MAKKYHHVSRKELKQDAVRDLGQNIAEYFELHRNKILTLAASLLTLVLVIVVTNRLVASNAQAASRQLSEIRKQYMRALVMSDAEVRTELIDELVGECASLNAKSPSSLLGREALYIKGNTQFLKEDYAKAAETYQEYLKTSETNEDKAKGNIALGYVYENQYFDDRENDALLKQAMAAFQEANKFGSDSEGKPNAHGSVALICLARLHEQNGEDEKAKEIYENIIKNRVFDDANEDEEEESADSQTPRYQQAQMIRSSFRDNSRRFTHAKIAEERLKKIQARQ